MRRVLTVVPNFILACVVTESKVPTSVLVVAAIVITGLAEEKKQGANG